MQLPTVPTTTATPRGDEDQLYRRHHRDLKRAVARVVNAAPELIEDACQNAWAILLRNQPERGTVFAWLRVVAVHEAYRLSAVERRDTHLEVIAMVVSWEDVIADPVGIDDVLEAREALGVLAELPARQRDDLALFVAGYSYREIAELHRRADVHQRQQAPHESTRADPTRPPARRGVFRRMRPRPVGVVPSAAEHGANTCRDPGANFRRAPLWF